MHTIRYFRAAEISLQSKVTITYSSPLNLKKKNKHNCT